MSIELIADAEGMVEQDLQCQTDGLLTLTHALPPIRWFCSVLFPQRVHGVRVGKHCEVFRSIRKEPKSAVSTVHAAGENSATWRKKGTGYYRICTGALKKAETDIGVAYFEDDAKGLPLGTQIAHIITLHLLFPHSLAYLNRRKGPVRKLFCQNSIVLTVKGDYFEITQIPL
eukprot:IDg17284t1